MAASSASVDLDSLPPELSGALARGSSLTARHAWRWPEFDRALPGGVVRGHVTEWAGPRSAGKTSALRCLVRSVLDAGTGAAYVDVTRTLTPASWATIGETAGRPPFWVVRPPGPADALGAAEELLRSATFGLVIVEGADWRRWRVVRLQRLARETAAALVAVVDRAGRVPLVGSRVGFSIASPPGAVHAPSRRVRVRGRGAHELSYVYELPYRLPEDPGFPDRRAPAV